MRPSTAESNVHMLYKRLSCKKVKTTTTAKTHGKGLFEKGSSINDVTHVLIFLVLTLFRIIEYVLLSRNHRPLPKDWDVIYG